MPKNWCFWAVVLEKTPEIPLDCKEIKPVHPKGKQSWIFINRTDAKAETPILWSPYVKKWIIGKDPNSGKFEGRRRRGLQRMRWLGGISDLMDMSKQDPADGEGQVSLKCCRAWGCKELDMTEQVTEQQRTYLWNVFVSLNVWSHT